MLQLKAISTNNEKISNLPPTTSFSRPTPIIILSLPSPMAYVPTTSLPLSSTSTKPMEQSTPTSPVVSQLLQVVVTNTFLFYTIMTLMQSLSSPSNHARAQKSSKPTASSYIAYNVRALSQNYKNSTTKLLMPSASTSPTQTSISNWPHPLSIAVTRQNDKSARSRTTSSPASPPSTLHSPCMHGAVSSHKPRHP